MARLPRYQESGLISADVPRLDFANIREASAYSQTITQSLDRISQFAFGKAREQQEQRNQILGIQMRTEYELEVQSELSKISDEIDRNEITDPEVAAERIRALSGYATELAQTSPQQANGLMTSISAGGRAMLAKISDKATAQYVADIDAKTSKVVRDTSKNLQDVYTLFGKGQISLEQLAQYEFGIQGIVESVARQSADATKKYLGDDGEFVKAKRIARSSAMTNYLASPDFALDETTALAKINSNDFGVLSDLAATFTAEEVIEVKKAVIDRFVENSNALVRQQNQRRAANDLRFVDSYKVFVDPKSTPEQKQEARQLMLQSADTTEEVDRVLSGPRVTSNPLLVSQLRDRIFKNQITDIRQLWQYSSVLSPDDLSKLQTEFMSADKSVRAKVSGDIRRWAGVPDNVTGIFNPKAEEFVREQAVRDIYDRLVAQEQQLRIGMPADRITPIDYEDLKDKAISQFETSNRADDKKNQARAKLEGYTEDKKLKNRIDQNTNIDDLRSTRKFSDAELEDIKAAQEVLRSQR